MVSSADYRMTRSEYENQLVKVKDKDGPKQSTDTAD